MAGNVFNEFAAVQAVREYDRANPLAMPPVEPVVAPAAPTPPAPASIDPERTFGETRRPAGPTQGPPPAMVPLFEAAAARHGVPINVIMAIAEQESAYNPRAVGTPTQWGRARGIMQYLDSTAQGLGINPYDPAQAIDGAALQIRQRLDRGASMQDAIREHFAGPNRALWGPRTQRYGEEVTARAARLADQIGDRYSRPAAAPEAVAPADPGAAAPGGSLLEDAARQTGAALVQAGGGAIRAGNIGLSLLRDYTPSRVVSDWLVGRPGGDERTTAALTGMADRVQAFAEQIRQGASPEMQRDIATTMPDGDLFSPSTWRMGSAPTVRGYIGIGAGLFGSLLPVIVAGVVGGPGAAAVVGGATGGGGGAETARDIIKEMGGRQIERDGWRGSALEAESPFYRQLRARGMSHDEALARTSEAAERYAFLLTTPVSAAGGAATGAILSPATRVAAGASLPGRIAARAGLGAVEEGLQEATETVAARTGTNIGAGTNLNVTEGTFADAVLGAMAGGSIGAAGGAMSRREEPAPRPGLRIGYPPRSGPRSIEGPETGGPGLPRPDGPRPASDAPDVIPMGNEDPGAPPQPGAEPRAAGPLERAVAQQTATGMNAGASVVIEAEGLDPIPGTVEYETPEGVMVRTQEGALLVPAEDIRSGAARVTPVAAPVAPGVPAAEGSEPAAGPGAGAAAPQPAPRVATPPLPSAPPASARPRSGDDAGPDGLRRPELAPPRPGFVPPEPSQGFDYAAADEPTLRARLRFLAQQGTAANGGWTPMLRAERKKTEAAIDRLTAAAKAAKPADPAPAAPKPTIAAPAAPKPAAPVKPVAALPAPTPKPPKPATARPPAVIALPGPPAQVPPAPAAPPPADDSLAARWNALTLKQRGERARAAGLPPTRGSWEALSPTSQARLTEVEAQADVTPPAPNVTTPAATAPEPALEAAPAAANVTIPPADVTTPAPTKAGTPAERADIAALAREMRKLAAEWDKLGNGEKAATVRAGIANRIKAGALTRAAVEKQRETIEAEKARRAKRDAPKPPREDSQQDAANREWAANYDRVVNAPDLVAVSAADIRRAIGYATHAREAAEGRALKEAMTREIGHMEAELKRRAAPVAAPDKAPEPAQSLPADPEAWWDRSLTEFGRAKVLEAASIPNNKNATAKTIWRNLSDARRAAILAAYPRLPGHLANGTPEPAAEPPALIIKNLRDGKETRLPVPPVAPQQPAADQGRARIEAVQKRLPEGWNAKLGGKNGGQLLITDPRGEVREGIDDWNDIDGSPEEVVAEVMDALDRVREMDAEDRAAKPAQVSPFPVGTIVHFVSGLYAAAPGAAANTATVSGIAADGRLTLRSPNGKTRYTADASDIAAGTGPNVTPKPRSPQPNGATTAKGKALFEKPAPQADPAPAPQAAPPSALDAAIAEAEAELAALFKAQTGRLNSGVDPAILGAGAKLGALYVAKGVVKFAEWAKAVVDAMRRMGVDAEAVKPTLKEIYLATQARVDDAQLDAMDGVRAVRAFDLTTLDEAPAAPVASPAVAQENATDAGPSVRDDGAEPLAGVAPEDGQGNAGGGDAGPASAGSEQGSGTAGSRPDGVGVPETRSGGSGAAGVDPAAAGGVASPKPKKPRAKKAPGQPDLAVSPSEAIQQASPINVPAIDFTIDDSLQLGRGTEGTKYQDNIAAIRTLRQIEAEGRRASPDEQRILARYVGWGGLKNAFRVAGAKDGAGVAKGWEKRVAEIEELLTPPELKAARNSTTAAHYTSQAVVQAMWKAAERLGFRGGAVLEPSVGTGNFLGLMPEGLRGRARTFAVEYDSLTARIASLLYPNATIVHSGFQSVPLPTNQFALAIGNPPFGRESLFFRYKPEVNGKSIHNQFFLASLASVRPGGIMAMVVSHNLMDALEPSSRLALAAGAEFVGGIRLPDTAFKENARTEVVTDMLFFRKRAAEDAEMAATAVEAMRTGTDPKETPPRWREIKREIEAWTASSTIADPAGSGENINANPYFLRNPGMVIGKINATGTMNARADLNVTLDDPAKFLPMLDAAVARLPEADPMEGAADASLRHFELMADAMRLAVNRVEVGAINRTADGVLRMVVDTDGGDLGKSILREIDLTADTPFSEEYTLRVDGKWEVTSTVDGPDGKPAKVLDTDGKPTKSNLKVTTVFENLTDIPARHRWGADRIALVSDLLPIKNLMKRQLVLESQDAPPRMLDGNRAKLNDAYDRFVEKHGPLHGAKVAKIALMMPDGGLAMAAEVSTGTKTTPAYAKAPIMSRRVTAPPQRQDRAGNATDAVAIVLGESGFIDLPRIAELLDTDEDGAAAALSAGESPRAFYDPETKLWEPSDLYLSGLVRRKLHAARAAGLEQNVKALEAVIPADWDTSQITPNPGSAWIPPQIYADFMRHIGYTSAKVSYSAATNSFTVAYGGKASPQWETGPRAHDTGTIFTRMLNSQGQRVTVPDADGKPQYDEVGTVESQQKASELFNEFLDWVYRDDGRRTELVRIFNEKFNTRLVRQRDGSHLTLPGKVPDAVIKMRRHQMNGIWRGITDPAVLYDHVVGAGKTFTAIARIMERRRMGLSNKPLVVVPNHLVEQWRSDVAALYPGANVLAAGKADFERKNRRRLFARIASGDFDMVIIGHSSFGFIDLDPATEERYLLEELQAAQAAVQEAEEQAAEDGHQGWGKPFGVAEAERLVAKLEARLERLRGGKRDRLLTFEEMGVDDLTVDEAHEFKNLSYSSRLTGVAGMGNKTGSQKAMDLHLKVRSLRERKGTSVAFLTGTPISNSVAEMYLILRNLAPAEMKEMGLENFDAWRTMFVSAAAAYEPTESGSVKEVTRLGREWMNMKSLMDLYYSVSDAVTIEDIKKAFAEDNPGQKFPVPEVASARAGKGDRAMVAVKPTPEQRAVLAEVVDGFEGLKDIKNLKERNIERLKLMDKARKIALDPRAVDPRAIVAGTGGKIRAVVENVARIHKKWAADRGTQIVFLDRSVPAAKGDGAILAAYDDLRDRLKKALDAKDDAAEAKVMDDLAKYDANEMEALRFAQAGGWNAYDEMKRQMVAEGIPADEIRFIQEANTDEQKKAMFALVKAGKVRVLIGSTPRLGAGTNVQDLLVALHHVDVTWKPSDIEQREGRIVRQGNRLLEKYGDAFEVEVLAYATEMTVDAKMWSLNAAKLKAINGIRKYDGSFQMEFEDEESASMAEMAALATGNPLMVERVTLDGDIKKLEMQQRSYSNRINAFRDKMASNKRLIARAPSDAAANNAFADMVEAGGEAASNASSKRKVTVQGKTYRDRTEARLAALSAVSMIRGDDEKARFSIEVGGEKVTSQEQITAKIRDALGTPDFQGEFGGAAFIHEYEMAKAVTGAINGKEAPNFTLDGVTINGVPIEFDVQRPGKAVYVTASAMGGGDRSMAETQISFEGALANAMGISGLVERLLNRLDPAQYRANARYVTRAAADAEKETPGILAELEKPWPKREELEAKRARQTEVLEALTSASFTTELSRQAGEDAPDIGDVSLSVPDFAQQVRDRLASGNERGPLLDMGRTPAVLRMLGLASLPLKMPGSVLFKLNSGKRGARPEMATDQIAKLPEMIDQPAAVLQSATEPGSLVVVTTATDSRGSPVIVAVARDRAAPGNPILRINVLTSAYGKDSAEWFRREAQAGRVLYIDREKALGRQVSSGVALLSDTEQGGQGPGRKVLTPDDVRKYRVQQMSDRFGPRLSEAPAGWGVAETQNDDAALTPEALASLGDILRVIAGPEAVLEQGRTGNADGIAAGPLVRLSMSLGEDRANWVTGHEAIHTLRNLGRITDKEWAILTDAAAREGWGERFGTERRYSNRTAEVRAEEAVAEAFAAWATGNLDGRGPVARIFQKVKSFLQRLQNALAGRGFKSRESIFQAIRDGEMGRRAPGSAAPTRLGTATVAQTSAALDARVDAGVFTQDVSGLIHLSVPPEQRAEQDGKLRNFLRDVIDRAQPAVLATVPLRPLLEEVAGYLPSAARFLRTKQAMDTMRSQWFATSAELSNKWLGYRSRMKAENVELMDLMHASTLAGSDPSMPGAAPELRKRFLALSKEGQALYAEVRDTYAELADAFDAALMQNVSEAVMARAKRAERLHQKEVARIEASRSMDADQKQAAREVADRALKREQTITRMNRGARMMQLRRQFETSRLKGPYFPLARFGDFFVTARDEAGEVVSYSLFEKPSEQMAFARQMERAGYSVTADRVSNEKGGMRGQVDPRFVAEVEGLLEGAGAPADLQDAIWQRFLQRMPDMSIRTSRIHRKGTAGFTRDAIRAFGHHMFHGSHQLARLNYAQELQGHVDEAREEAKDSGKPNQAVAVVNEMQNRMDFIMNPTGGALAHGLTSAAFVYHLSASPAAALVNLSQVALMGVPILAANNNAGVAAASAALLRAIKDVAAGRGRADRAPDLTTDEKSLIREIYEIGLADNTQAHDLAGISETGVAYNNTRHKVMSVLSWAYHHAERMNREATALAAYRMQRKAGMDHAAAVEEANRLTWKIHFDYQNTSRPRVMQNDTAKVLLVFRNFTVNMLFRLFRDTHQMLRGETAEVRREARSQLVGMTMMMMATAGIKGVWGYGIAMTLAGLFFGAGEDEEDELRKWMQRNLGVTAAGILLDGLPGYGLGISLSERIGMPDLWFRSSDRLLEGKEAFWYWVGQGLGALFGIADNMQRGVNMALDGNVTRGIETAAPKAIKDLMRAARFTAEGATNLRGDALLESVPPGDVIRQALGFTPARLAEIYGQANSATNAVKEIGEERTRLLTQYYRASRGEDVAEMRRLEGRMDRFSDEHPDAAIRPRDLVQSMRQRARISAQTANGVRLPPRQEQGIRERLPERTYN